MGDLTQTNRSMLLRNTQEDHIEWDSSRLFQRLKPKAWLVDLLFPPRCAACVTVLVWRDSGWVQGPNINLLLYLQPNLCHQILVFLTAAKMRSQTSRKMTDKRKISFLEWPSRCPDLNPVDKSVNYRAAVFHACFAILRNITSMLLFKMLLSFTVHCLCSCGI